MDICQPWMAISQHESPHHLTFESSNLRQIVIPGRSVGISRPQSTRVQVENKKLRESSLKDKKRQGKGLSERQEKADEKKAENVGNFNAQ